MDSWIFESAKTVLEDLFREIIQAQSNSCLLDCNLNGVGWDTSPVVGVGTKSSIRGGAYRAVIQKFVTANIIRAPLSHNVKVMILFFAPTTTPKRLNLRLSI